MKSRSALLGASIKQNFPLQGWGGRAIQRDLVAGDFSVASKLLLSAGAVFPHSIYVELPHALASALVS